MREGNSLNLLVALGLAAAVTLVSPSTSRQAPARYVSAQGSGTVEVTPSLLEMRVVALGEADIAAEACTAFEDARRRGIAAYEGLGIEGLAVVPLGQQLSYSPPIEVDPQRGMMMNQFDVPEGARCWEVLLVKVPLTADMDSAARGELAATLVDTAIDGGFELLGGLGTPPNYRPSTSAYDYGADGPVRWSLPDTEELEQRARAAAIEDARQQALEAAAAAGGRLGAISSVTLQPAQRAFTHRMPQYYSGPTPAGVLLEEVSSAGVVQVRATVRFDLE